MDERLQKQIEAAANDPRFDTPWKRLCFFRRPNESDDRFAKRLRISMGDLYNWKEGDLSRMTVDLIMQIARRLDVSHQWLADGTSHIVDLMPDGKHRLTTFHRFRPWHQFGDEPGAHEVTSLYDCRNAETKPSATQSEDEIAEITSNLAVIGQALENIHESMHHGDLDQRQQWSASCTIGLIMRALETELQHLEVIQGYHPTGAEFGEPLAVI